MTFRVGMEVECIDDSVRNVDPRSYPGGHYAPNWPVKGCTYTIRDIGKFGLLLHEIVNPARDFLEEYGEAHFDPRRFRPIIKRATDISIFTQMLRPSKVDA